MKQVDALLLLLLAILGGVAFLNFGNVNLSSGPRGIGFGAGYARPGG
jgi:hypothetical protein